ncbi:MAG: M28 family peptidase, partial [Candidatus Poribacteria bacterium]|nr:M28 family peptidase [Candidatus Poribacteria bacterium]
FHRDAANNAAQYIANQFWRSPRLKVEFEDFSGMRNVVAKLPPKQDSASDRIFILCAHYDTKANREPDWNPLTLEAPGGDDNATGVAAMLEIAHLLSRFDYEHELRFIAFDGKEIGLMGSRHHAQKATRAGENIVAAINIDMIGFNWKVDGVEVVTDAPSAWLEEAFSVANQWYGLDLTVRGTRDDPSDDSDHRSFWDKDYRAVSLTESTTPWRDSDGYEANPFYHTSRDTIDQINLRLVRKVTQLALVTLNSLAIRSSQKDKTAPEITIDSPTTADQNPVQVTGHFESLFPVEIFVDPGGVPARLDRSNQTYSANVFLNTGGNIVRATILDALGARSVEQIVRLTPEFEWQSALVFPNPSRQNDVLTVFRAEGNLPIDEMNVFVYTADGELVKQLPGVADRADARIWRVWWNHRVALGAPVAAGVYVCRFEVRVSEDTFSLTQKLAIIR